ncbi:hypothetical protein K7432_007360 [Basidiobolus ranarum]|uniref:Uncharacterized protein n=1 Tax=Basidiobolus ranarum TaxID=34480 RepID=A0ABR2W056_9FUNG
MTMKTATFEHHGYGYCTAKPDKIWPIAMLGSETGIVLFLSWMFIQRIYQHNQVLSPKILSMLMKHGYIFPILILSFNLLFAVLTFTNVTGVSMGHLLRIGWILNSWLVMKQTEHSHKLHQIQIQSETTAHPANFLKEHQALGSDPWDVHLNVHKTDSTPTIGP